MRTCPASAYGYRCVEHRALLVCEVDPSRSSDDISVDSRATFDGDAAFPVSSTELIHVGRAIS